MKSLEGNPGDLDPLTRDYYPKDKFLEKLQFLVQGLNEFISG